MTHKVGRKAVGGKTFPSQYAPQNDQRVVGDHYEGSMLGYQGHPPPDPLGAPLFGPLNSVIRTSYSGSLSGHGGLFSFLGSGGGPGTSSSAADHPGVHCPQGPAGSSAPPDHPHTASMAPHHTSRQLSIGTYASFAKAGYQRI